MIGIDEVWVAVARPAALPATLLAWLDADDRAHVARLRRPQDQCVAAASRMVQRWVLASAAGLSPAALRFAAGPQGRPHLVAPTAATLVFSATNTDGLVGCAVAGSGLVGLDAEPLARPLPEELLSGCCSAHERAALAALPAAERGAWFHRLWTLKEAWFKARGAGIDREPRAVDFSFDAGSGMARPQPGPAAGWRFRLLDASPAHALALCVDRPARIRLRWIAWDQVGAIDVADGAVPDVL